LAKSVEALEVGDMSSPVRRTREIHSFKPAVSNSQSRAETTVSQDKIRLLKICVVELQQELESLSEVPAPDVEQGLDFYDEVTRFEIDLIRRALIFNGGHQGKAARLLNLKAKTLNAKIKRYQIKLGRIAGSTVRHQNNGDG
jgi:transcriptional regulator with GAF, ATPase, and Fis domain